MSTQENPYAAPTASDSPAADSSGIGEYAPCPKCGGTTAKKITYTWWGGWVGPRMFRHVRCVACGAGYNGGTGKSNRP